MADRASESESAADISVSKGVDVGDGRERGRGFGDSVSKGVGIRDGRGSSVMCVFVDRCGAVTCVVGGSKGVGSSKSYVVLL